MAKMFNLKFLVMTKKKRDLSKYVRMFRSAHDLYEQFAADVEKFGNKFAAIAEEHFDMKNVWDQGVMVAILTNMLAFVEVNVELMGDNIEDNIKSFYKDNLEKYRAQAREEERKLGIKH
jgi:hypothetical protein